MTLTIKQAKPSDANLIGPVFDAYRVFYQQTSDIGLAESFISERLSNKQSVIFFAFDADLPNPECLGFVQLYPMYSSVSAKPLLVLNDLFVAQAARKKGLARRLMEAAKEEALKCSAKGLILETDTHNVNAQALYESLGYTKTDDVYHYFLPV
jgi:ribosomal protein S18 acetylase RimI-like enzyme